MPGRTGVDYGLGEMRDHELVDVVAGFFGIELMRKEFMVRQRRSCLKVDQFPAPLSGLIDDPDRETRMGKHLVDRIGEIGVAFLVVEIEGHAFTRIAMCHPISTIDAEFM